MSDVIKNLDRQARREAQMADLLIVRLSRAFIYFGVIYILLWQQTVFDGSYMLVAFTLAGLSMVNSTQTVVQVFIGLLAVVVLLSDLIGGLLPH